MGNESFFGSNMMGQEGWARRGEVAAAFATASGLLPVGVPVPWPTNTAPSGWLICDGSAVPAGCPQLSAVYGANLPNLKGRVIVGRDAAQTEFDTVLETGGAKTHTLTEAEMPSHAHTGNSGATTITQSGNGLVSGSGNPPVVGAGTIAAATGGSGAHNNLQPYTVFNYIVEAA